MRKFEYKSIPHMFAWSNSKVDLPFTQMKITGKYFDDRIEKGSSIGSCRSPSRELQIERKTSGTLGDHCKLMIAQERYDGSPLQYSCLENSMDGGAWQAAVHGVAKSQTRLSDFTFTFHFHALEKEMATHSSVLAWRIPGTGEPGGLPSLGSHKVGHD